MYQSSLSAAMFCTVTISPAGCERAVGADLVEHLLDVGVLGVGEQVASRRRVAQRVGQSATGTSRDLSASKIAVATSPCSSCRTDRSSLLVSKRR